MHPSLPNKGAGAPAQGEEMPGNTGNRILDELPQSTQPAFRKKLVELAVGTQIVSQGRRITTMFFPTTAVCSLVIELASGDKAETAAVGRDGFVGVPVVLGIPVSQSSGVIQVAGAGYSIQPREVLDLCKEHDAFRKALFGYAAFRLHLASRSIACNSFHSIVQRLARWLLFAHDRAGTMEFPMTHESLSTMLAATRPRVSQAAAKLRAAGIIDYRRGTVSIRDRARLKAVSCECYEETKGALSATRQ